MKKSERLHDLIQYLNGKTAFSLCEVMQRYQIAKSTALRDVAAIEALGMPLYSEAGRYGRYVLLPNKLLSPVLFCEDEALALYFSMAGLKAYQSTPFDYDLQRLQEKVERCLTPKSVQRLRKVAQVLWLDPLGHPHASPFLRQIVEAALDETPLRIQYRGKTKPTAYDVQFYGVTSRFGQWYALGYVLAQQATRVFRCDKIEGCQALPPSGSLPLAQLQVLAQQTAKHPEAVDFEVALRSQCADRFYKEPYPSMQLNVQAGQALLTGYYNPGEENFIAAYVAGFGAGIVRIRPQALGELVAAYVADVQQAVRRAIR